MHRSRWERDLRSILGISAFYHDSAAALVVDGKVVAAAQEERFTRVKHDASFPSKAIEFCLETAGVSIEQIDYVVFYEKPFLKLERILETYLAHAPRGFASFRKAIPIWLKEKLYQSSRIRRGLDQRYHRKIVFLKHHQSHAASAFFTSPFETASILTVDGVGEWATTTLGVGHNHTIEIQEELRFPHSLGLLYSAATAYCGFHVNGGEGKLMGLAPYGEPEQFAGAFEKLIDIKKDGSYRLNLDYFDPVSTQSFFNQRFCDLMGGPPRQPESPIEQRFKNVAASVQALTEEVMLGMSRFLHNRHGERNLCLAGGVALNCVANGRIHREGGFDNVWIQPAAGDAGGALGAALFVWHQLLEMPRAPSTFHPFLGPTITAEDDIGVLNPNWQVSTFESRNELATNVAKLLADQKTVAIAQGRMELGPRALGCRSILADPRQRSMWDRMNLTVKKREAFRPFAPAILANRTNEYFDHQEASHFMLLTVDTKVPIQNGGKELKATTHVDGTSRIQTVSEGSSDGQSDLFLILSHFEAQTGCPALLNTSFNVRGQPIVASSFDALRAFETMALDALVLGNRLILKPNAAEMNDRSEFAGSSLSGEAENLISNRRNALSIWGHVARCWKWLTFPIRWLVSSIAMSMLFFGVFVPLGWIWRRSNPSFLNPDASETSYWIDSEQDSDLDSYFKQH